MSKDKLVRTARVKVYKFEGLSEAAQQKAIDSMRDINVDHDWWDCTYEDLKTLCETLGIEVDVNKTWFNGFSHQGQGSSFTADIPSTVKTVRAIIVEKWKDYAPNEQLYLKKPSQNVLRILRLIEASLLSWSADIEPAGRETHVKVNTSYRFQDGYKSNLANLEKTLEDLEGYLQEAADTLNHWFFKQLETEYEYLTSDESIKDTILANDYEFTGSGELFKEK